MRRTEKRSRKRGFHMRRQRGTQVLELAIALPLLCFLAFLVTEAAALVRVHQVINNAAREAARISSLYEGNSVADVEGAARAYVTTYVPTACATNTDGNPVIDVTVDQTLEVDPGGSFSNIKASRVTVTCNYRLVWVPPFFQVNPTIPLKGTAVFRNLR